MPKESALAHAAKATQLAIFLGRFPQLTPLVAFQ